MEVEEPGEGSAEKREMDGLIDRPTCDLSNYKSGDRSSPIPDRISLFFVPRDTRGHVFVRADASDRETRAHRRTLRRADPVATAVPPWHPPYFTFL